MYRRTATVVCIGTFVRPWALLVHGETPSKFFVFWDELNLSQAPVQVRQCQLPAELGSAICGAWERVLSQTRYPKEPNTGRRSEEHTSELQSPCNLVCRLLLEKKKKKKKV